MNIEVSTINAGLLLIVAMQCWIVRQIFTIKTRLAVIASHCHACKSGDLAKETEPAL